MARGHEEWWITFHGRMQAHAGSGISNRSKWLTRIDCSISAYDIPSIWPDRVSMHRDSPAWLGEAVCKPLLSPSATSGLSCQRLAAAPGNFGRNRRHSWRCVKVQRPEARRPPACQREPGGFVMRKSQGLPTAGANACGRSSAAAEHGEKTPDLNVTVQCPSCTAASRERDAGHQQMA